MPSDSMNIGVTGMDAYQQQIDVISNNIANVGTAGYKGQRVTFQDLLYQTQLPASGPTKTNGGANLQQVGIGVKVGSTDTNLLQGGVQTTGVNTNLMINGNGYFILNNTDGSGTPRYTRNGDFSLNQNGTLYDPSSGLGVMGYAANSAGIINAAGAPQPIQIPIGLASSATATGEGVKLGPPNDKNFDLTFAGNLNSANYAAAVSIGTALPDTLISSGTTIYDSLGGAHLVDITFQPALSSAGNTPMPFLVSNPSGVLVTAATEWAFTLSSTDGTLFGGGAAPAATSPVQYAFFDQHGHFINTSGISAPTAPGLTIGTANVHLAGATAAAIGGDTLTIAQWGGAHGANNATTPGSATPLPPSPLGLDFSAMTSNASSDAAIDTGQNGTPPGTLSNISVGLDGVISGSFTNGQVMALARVSLATFQNAQGLIRVGGSQYAQSVNSGEPQVGTANSGGFGAIDGDSLELSNVSIADEFTKLITAQNAFAANSKSITTANENLQTVIGLIR